MTRALFSGVCDSTSDIENDIDICQHSIPGSAGSFVYFYRDDGSIRIHWFEFCIQHLAEKIAKALSFRLHTGKLRYRYALGEICVMNKQHPVDFLYQEFIKTDTWKSLNTSKE